MPRESEQPDGMTERDQWRQSSVHKASRYFCAKCGREFAMPHDLYAHLDQEHPADDRDD